MTKKITLEEALKLVSFYHHTGCGWQVNEVNGDVGGDLNGNLYGDLNGNLYGDLNGNLYRDVTGYAWGTINGRKWKFLETSKEKLQKLLDGASEEELLKLINQLEDNND